GGSMRSGRLRSRASSLTRTPLGLSLVVLLAMLLVIPASFGVTRLILGGSDENAPAGPFREAVTMLTDAEGIRYRTSILGGTMTFDVRMTGKAEGSGTITILGRPADLLVVDGRIFVRLPVGFASDLLGDLGQQQKALEGKWITGGPD